MAKMLRGKNKGKIVKLSQWANGWFSTTDGKIIDPTSLEFTDEEIEKIRTSKNTGLMFDKYYISGNRMKRINI